LGAKILGSDHLESTETRVIKWKIMDMLLM
jgi:hypothetical protein